MNLRDKLNSGVFHAAARANRPRCVDVKGNIHHSEERAAFVNWRYEMAAAYGQDPKAWPCEIQAELEARFVR